MNAARRAARAGRNLLIALLLGAVIIVVIIIAYMAGRSSHPSAGPTSAAAASQRASRSTTTVSNDAAPTGCLGGAGRDNAMLLSAQKTAQASTYGAVEVATAFYRWSYRYPVPSNADVKSVGAIFAPGASAKSESSLIAGYKANPNPAAGTVAGGTPFYLSTVGGRWTAQTGSSKGEQLISVQTPYVIDGAISATKTATAAFQMQRIDGAWRVVGLAEGDPAKVAAGGTTFTSGC